MSYKNNVISNDDPQAVEKLTEKLNACEERQKYMKEANKYYRKNGTMQGFDNITAEQAVKLDGQIKGGYSWEQVPFASYKLTNNNAEIRRLKKRIEQLTTDKTIGFSGWKFPGGEAVANISNNRLQLLFDEKPTEEQRRELKVYGFHWSPSEGAWQRQLNSNAIYAANRIDFIQPGNGQRPTDLLDIKATRTLTTESTAVLSPYKTQEIIDKNGLYYGINAISHSLLMCNRKLLLNGNGFILGVSGSGKSFAAKMEILMTALFSNDDIIIVDAEREYISLVQNLGGEIIKLSAASENHINALEINNDIDMDESPVSIKSEFLISLFDQLLRNGDARMGGGVGAKDKSIIDRCTIKVYDPFLNGSSDYMPTLADFRNELLKQPETEAQDLALSLEIFTTGSLNAFAHQSDVDVNSRIVCYDILELGEQMKSIGLLIMLDNIFNRVMANRKRGRYTRVYIDEAHLYFKNPYSADFLLKCWKRFRKYGGLLTGITQNISDCLLNETARGMLANSEFLLLLNQSPSDRKDLSELLSISDTQMNYITNAGAGRGLIKVGGSIVPFVNDFPTDTQLYKLMSTKPGEG